MYIIVNSFVNIPITIVNMFGKIVRNRSVDGSYRIYTTERDLEENLFEMDFS